MRSDQFLLNWNALRHFFRISLLINPLFFSLSSCSYDPVPEGIDAAISSVKGEYAPDKRVALFEVAARATAEGITLSGETNLPAAKEALLETLRVENYRFVDQIEVLPATDLGDKTYGVAVLSASNIRSEPRHSGELATQATMGTPLRVWKKQEDWFLVQTPDGYLGWLDAGGFVAMSPASYESWKQVRKVVFLPDFGFLLSRPEATSPPEADLLAGNILQFLEVEDNFIRVATPDGREGYVPAATAMDYSLWLASHQPDADRILASARNFMGRPYLWGGTSGKGVDCSGFTKTVFYLNGVLLPRDASQQVHTGTDIATDSTFSGLQPGDLLFFGRKATSEQPEKIVHVAIYLGGGRIIHSSGIVKVESLRRADPDFNEYRFDTFVRAKRILGSIGKNGIHLLAETEFY